MDYDLFEKVLSERLSKFGIALARALRDAAQAAEEYRGEFAPDSVDPPPGKAPKKRNLLVEPDWNDKEEPFGPTTTKQGTITPAGIGNIWNQVAGRRGLPSVFKLTGARLRKIRAAIKEESDPYVWGIAIRMICDDPFLTGKNDRDTVYATIDYLLQPSKREKWFDLAREDLLRNPVS